MVTNSDFSRREFLKTISVAGAVAVVAPVLGGMPALASADFETVGRLDEFSEGDYKKVTLSDAKSAYVTRKGATVVALSARCTHKGCDVLWVPAHKSFQCPCHGGLFDADGKVISGPPKSPLVELKSKVEGGNVLVKD